MEWSRTVKSLARHLVSRLPPGSITATLTSKTRAPLDVSYFQPLKKNKSYYVFVYKKIYGYMGTGKILKKVMHFTCMQLMQFNPKHYIEFQELPGKTLDSIPINTTWAHPGMTSSPH